MEPIVSCVCEEPEGNITRNIYPLYLTVDNLKLFWEKARKFPTIFSQEINSDFNAFCNLFLGFATDGSITSNGIFYVIDDWVGVFYINQITKDRNAQVHYIFFDMRHKGRLNMTQQMLSHVFNELRFERLSVTVPTYAKDQTHRFVKRLGFKQEGKIRRVRYFRNRWHDDVLYGMLKEEITQELENGTAAR